MAMALLLVGFAAILSSLIYLGYYMIALLMDKKNPFKKPLFFPLLVGGITFSIIGFVTIEESSANKLEEEILKNETLAEEHTLLQEEFKSLTQDFEELTQSKDQLLIKLSDKEKELSSLNAQAKEHDKEKSAFKEKIDSLQAEIEQLNADVKTLTSENSSLQATIDDLKTTTVASTSSASSGSSEIY
ncbi:hypothetical protein, partial [Halobacillus sp. BBL2006]|uniref:hypothetical protein n=1 Tax=Halobacillus sp. BBL2006 TaxID=1543706 RepID=UPI00054250D1